MSVDTMSHEDKLDRLISEVGGLGQRLDRVSLEVQYIRGKLDDFATRDEMNARFAQTEAKIETVRDELRADMREGFARQDGKLDEFREEFNQFRVETRENFSHLRVTTAQGFQAMVALVQILHGRIERIERYLDL